MAGTTQQFYSITVLTVHTLLFMFKQFIIICLLTTNPSITSLLLIAHKINHPDDKRGSVDCRPGNCIRRPAIRRGTRLRQED